MAILISVAIGLVALVSRAPATSDVSLNASSRSNTIALQAFPSVVPDGGSVVISWGSGLTPNPPTDFVSYSCGPTNNVSDVIDQQSIVDDHTPIRFTNLVNMRCDYVFLLVRNSSVSHIASKTNNNDSNNNRSANNNDNDNNHNPSNTNTTNTTNSLSSLQILGSVTVSVEGGHYAPIQGHVSLADSDTEMWVSWVSGRADTSTDTTPTVQYGTQGSGVYTHTTLATTSSTTYLASDLCNAPANLTNQILWRFPGYFHHVLLTDLTPSTAYYYVYGSVRDGWSEERSFVSKPRADSRDTVRFIAYGDQDWDDPSPGSPTTAALALRDVVDGYNAFVLHFGDMSYGMGDVSDWDHWGREIEPYATRSPYMVSLGNHEFDYTSGGEKSPTGGGENGFHVPGLGDDSNGECGVPVVHRFKGPSNGNLIAWYSFNYASVHVVQFSSEHDWRRGSQQWLWLEADLKAVNRTATPWIVVTAHRMMYSTQADAGVTPALMRDHLEDLMYTHKVNLFLVGHQHSYERFCAVYNGSCADDGVSATTYIIAGTAGAGVDTKNFSSSKISLVQSQQWGYLRASATPHNLTVQFVANSLGEMWDEVVLRPWGF